MEGTMPGTQIDNQLIADLARDVVAKAAPQEMPLFRANSDAYFKDPQKALKPAEGRDEALGFGVEAAAVFITPFAMAVMSEVVKFLTSELQNALKAEGSDAVKGAVKSLFKKFRPPEETKIPSLTPKQLAQVRKLALEKALQLKLSESKAALLADSIIGSLAV
jgi:hypothetical protein